MDLASGGRAPIPLLTHGYQPAEYNDIAMVMFMESGGVLTQLTNSHELV